MYDRSRLTVVGRIIWFIVSLLIFIGLVWLVLWFFFWRSPEPTDNAADKSTTSQESKENSTENKNSSESASGTSGASTTGDGSSSNSNTTGTTSSTSTQTPAQSTTTGDSSTTGSSEVSVTVNDSTSSTQATGQTNEELANAGPGSLVIPVVVAVVGGATLYHVRLRRRLLSE